HGPGEPHQVGVHADGAVEEEYAAPEEHADGDESEVEQAVEEPAPFAPAVHRGDRAPERGHAEQVQPEGEILARPVIDEVGDEEHRKPEGDRYPLPERELPVAIAGRAG